VVFDELSKVIILYLLSSVTGQKNPRAIQFTSAQSKETCCVFTNQKQTKTTRDLAYARFPALGTGFMFPALGIGLAP